MQKRQGDAFGATATGSWHSSPLSANLGVGDADPPSESCAGHRTAATVGNRSGAGIRGAGGWLEW